MSMENKKVHGHGVSDIKTVDSTGSKLKSYVVWAEMLNRCYSPRVHARRPSYIGCSVCDEWMYFSNFKKWHDTNYKEGFSLDKDLMVRGNKVYSPETCRYVPEGLNSIVAGMKRSKHHRIMRGKICAYLSVLGGQHWVGYCDSVEECVAKTNQLKRNLYSQYINSVFDEKIIREDVKDAFLTLLYDLTI